MKRRSRAATNNMKSIYCLLLVFCALPSLFAQTATLRGQVTDESGAVIPGAKVTLSGPAGAVKTTTADKTGSYTFAAVPPGSYRVLASAPRLAQAAPAEVSLKAGLQVLNLMLKVASIAEKVTVEDSSAPAIGTDSSSSAGAVVLSGEDLQALSDDPDDLAADLQALAGPSAGPSGGSIFVGGFSGGQLPAKESIREIRINQNPFSPEYDKLGYGKIEIFTKPGSDKFHGSVGYNLGTDWWNSRNPYSATKAPFLLQETENSFSGPLTKHSSFRS